jgi:hypothetical protein
MAYAVNYLMSSWLLAPFAGVNLTTLAAQCGPNCYSYASNYFQLNSTYASPQVRMCFFFLHCFSALSIFVVLT